VARTCGAEGLAGDACGGACQDRAQIGQSRCYVALPRLLHPDYRVSAKDVEMIFPGGSEII